MHAIDEQDRPLVHDRGPRCAHAGVVVQECLGLLARKDLGGGSPQNLVGGQPEIAQELGVDVAVAPFPVLDEHRHRTVIHERAQLRLAGRQVLSHFAQLRFRAQLFGHVLDQTNGIADAAIAAVHGGGGDPRGEEAAVLAQVPPVGNGPCPFAGDQFFTQPQALRSFLRVDEVGERHLPKLALAVAEHPLQRAIRLDEAACDIVEGDAVRGMVERRSQQFLALGERPLGELAVGDVMPDTAVTAEGAVPVEHRFAAGQRGVVDRAVVLVTDEFEIAEGLVRGERHLVRFPLGFGQVADANFPACLAQQRGRLDTMLRQDCTFDPGVAELLVLLPVPVRGKLGEAPEALLALAQRRFGTHLFRNVVSHASHDRHGNALGAQRVGVFPESFFAGPGLHNHQPAGNAVLLDSVDVIVELRPPFGREDIANVHVQQLRRLVAQDFRGPRVDRADAPVQVVRADQVLAVLHEVAVAILAFLQRSMRPATLERSREHVCNRLHELDLDRLESTPRAGVCGERSKRAFDRGDHHADGADHPQLAHPERIGKAPIGPQILDRHRLRRLQRFRTASPVEFERVSGLGVRAGPDAHAEAMLRPVVPCYDAERALVPLQFERSAEVNVQRFGDQSGDAFDQAFFSGFAKREQAEFGERLLPPQRRAQLRCRMPLLRDITAHHDHPGYAVFIVPDRAALGLNHAHGAVARHQPVLGAMPGAGTHRVAENLADALAILGVDLLE